MMFWVYLLIAFLGGGGFTTITAAVAARHHKPKEAKPEPHVHEYGAWYDYGNSYQHKRCQDKDCHYKIERYISGR